MIDKLSGSTIGLGAATGAEWSGSAQPHSPALPVARDVERFQMALHSPASTINPPVTVAWNGVSGAAGVSSRAAEASTVPGASSLPASSAAEGASVTARAAQAGRRSVGDAILDSFRSVAQNASQDWGQARQAIMKSGSMTTTEMLQTQMHLIQVSFQIDLIGKGVSKVTTNLEQTLKTQ